MLNSFRTKKSNVLVWVLMVLLIVGLAGFGIGIGGGLASNDVARVGDRGISAQDYARALDQEIRAISEQTGRNLTMGEAREFGIDRLGLARLVNNAALDLEAERLGLSAGDDTVRRRIESVPAFRGAEGFDPDAYAFALERIGLTPSEFEAETRREAARALVAGGVAGGVAMPPVASRTVLDFLGERRGFVWLRLGEEQLDAPLPEPTHQELTAYHEGNADRYTRPETRRVTFALADPGQVAAGIEIPEAELREAYDADPDRFGSPERRILDRIGYGSEEEAAAAKAGIDAGEATFDEEAERRGLDPADTELGSVTAADLSPEAREAVFAAEGPGIVGPVETPLGPSLFRINAILNAESVPFEEARDALSDERREAAAQGMLADELSVIEDLIAGGARLEEIASETVMELGEMAFNEESSGELASDPAFREAVAAAREGEETDLVELEDGGLVTLRVEAVEPPALIPLEQVREAVAEDWRAAQAAAALREQAEALAEELGPGLTMEALAERLGVAVETAEPMTRGETLPGAPPRLIADIFAAEDGEAVVVEDGASVILARLSRIEPFDPEEEGMATVMDDVDRQFTAQAAEDALALFTAALRDREGVRVDQRLIDSTIAQFQ
jgi:peptidyl-prolyl cis-trans isomerase D